jgi:hypothetical protein
MDSVTLIAMASIITAGLTISVGCIGRRSAKDDRWPPR